MVDEKRAQEIVDEAIGITSELTRDGVVRVKDGHTAPEVFDAITQHAIAMMRLIKCETEEYREGLQNAIELLGEELQAVEEMSLRPRIGA